MNRDYIIGIYNMCDYWCDRCAFTRRCRNFETSERLANERGSTRTDEKNQEMWDSVDAVLVPHAAAGQSAPHDFGAAAGSDLEYGISGVE